MLTNHSQNAGGTSRSFFSSKAVSKSAEETQVTPISMTELQAASVSPGAFMVMLKDNRAPLSIFRNSDVQLRNFHVNVRAAVETVEAAPNKEALVAEMRTDTKLTQKASVGALVLYTLGHYALNKNKEGKRPEAYFWSRDQGVQAYLAENNIPSSQTADKIRSLGGVHLTYTTWTSTRKPKGGTMAKPRVSFAKALREAIAEVEEGVEVTIRASVGRGGKLTFINATVVNQ